MSGELRLRPVHGIGEVTGGTDLAALACEAGRPVDGDVVVVTSKAVSKAEGRVVEGEREAAIDAETVRLVARRGPTRIVENRLGLVMAAAGVDASNVAPGRLVLLPEDPDASARRLREGVLARLGANVAVVVTDTAGRAWRHGQVDLAIGLAGLEPLEDFAGRVDGYGNELAVTAPAVGDEIAAAAELAAGKLGGVPMVVVSGLADRVLPPGEHGPGARAVVRERGTDMFGLGAREAVVVALADELSPMQAAAFGSAGSGQELLAALHACGVAAAGTAAGIAVPDERDLRVATALARAHGWQVRRRTEVDGSTLILEPLS